MSTLSNRKISARSMHSVPTTARSFFHATRPKNLGRVAKFRHFWIMTMKRLSSKWDSNSAAPSKHAPSTTQTAATSSVQQRHIMLADNCSHNTTVKREPAVQILTVPAPNQAIRPVSTPKQRSTPTSSAQQQHPTVVRNDSRVTTGKPDQQSKPQQRHLPAKPYALPPFQTSSHHQHHHQPASSKLLASPTKL